MGSLLGGKTKSTTTQNQTWGPTQYVADAYKGLINQAQGVAKTPYNPATAQKVAGFTAPQYQGFAGVQNNQGAYQPYMDQAAGLATLGSSAITGDQIAGYMNPYTDQVIDASMNDWQRMAQRRMTDTNSNASKIGALTGDRSQVAQALAREASDNEMASGIAGLRKSGWDSALGAAQNDAGRALQGAQIQGSLGGLAQQYGYNDAQALLGIGGMQQDQQQKVLDAATLNAKTKSAYPFETTQWLGNILQGIGSQAGGESTGTGTTTQKSGGGWLSKALGLGSMLFGMPGMANGGSVGDPSNVSYVPVSGMQPGNAMQPPQMAAPQVSSGQSSGGMSELLDSFKQAQTALNSDSGGGLGSLVRTSTDPASGWSTTVNPSSASGWGNYLSNGISSGLSGLASGLGGMFGFANGGMVPAYADGGEVYDPFVQFGNMREEAPQRPMQAGLAPLAAQPPSAHATAPAAQPAPKEKGWGSMWGNGLSDDANQAIFMAGLGMLGGGGRDAFEDVGRGGLMGLQFYSQAKQQHKTEAQAKAKEAEGKLMEIGGKLVRVMPDGTTSVVYDGTGEDVSFERIGDGTLVAVNKKTKVVTPIYSAPQSEKDKAALEKLRAETEEARQKNQLNSAVLRMLPQETAPAPSGGVQPQSFNGSAPGAGVILTADGSGPEVKALPETIKTPIGEMTPEEAKKRAFALSLVGKGDAGKLLYDETENELQKKTKGDLEEKTMSTATQLGRLADIQKQFDPKYLEVATRLKLTGAGWTAKLGGQLAPEVQKQLGEFAKFRSAAVNNLNAILKEVSGAAVTPQEYERIQSDQPTAGTGIFDGDDPVSFKAKMESTTARLKAAMARLNFMRSSGLKFDRDNLDQFMSLDEVPDRIRKRGAEIEGQIKSANPGIDPATLQDMTKQKLKREWGI